MIWSPLDLRSTVFLIAVGNALAATGLALHRGVTGVSRTYIAERVCQSAGWFLIWQIGHTPLWLNYLTANVLLQLGLTLEALAVLSVTRRRRGVEIFFAIWFAVIVAGTAFRYFVPFTAAELNRVNIEASVYAMVIVAVPALLKGRGAAGSRGDDRGDRSPRRRCALRGETEGLELHRGSGCGCFQLVSRIRAVCRVASAQVEKRGRPKAPAWRAACGQSMMR